MGRELDRFTSTAHASARFVAQRMLLKPLVWSLTRVTVEESATLRELEGPFIVVANHASHLDAPLITGALPRKLARYLAAGAAADYFFDVWWRKGLTALFFNAFPVDRGGSGQRNPSGTSRELLARGVPLLVFPEGTRSKSGVIGRFKTGAAALSLNCDVPCLPVAIIGASEAMPRDTSWPVRGRPKVVVAIGDPMRALPGEKAEGYSERINAEVKRLHAKHTSYAIAPSAPHDAPAIRPATGTEKGLE